MGQGRGKAAHRSLIVTGLALLVAGALGAQTPNLNPHPPGEHSSRNMRVVAHVPLGGDLTIADMELEQDMARPYAYVSRSREGNHGFDIIDLSGIDDEENGRVIYRWTIENSELHQGSGGRDAKYFKLGDRYYFIASFQFRGGGPNQDLGGIVFDVTGLPDTSTIREIGRIRMPLLPGGWHNIFVYKHSDGHTYLFATVESPVGSDLGVNVYDMEIFVNGGSAEESLVSYVPLPEPRGAARGYHDAYAGYDPATGQDKFYGGGPETSYEGGNYVWDVSDIRNPEFIGGLRAIHAQQAGGHTFVPTPDHRYAMTVMTSLGHQPVRFFDLKPILDGEVEIIHEPIGAWTQDWRKSVHMLEVRWPYLFIGAYTMGVQVVYMKDPTRPFTYAFYDTYPAPEEYTGGGTARGVFGIDVRNADGLIVASDGFSGLWAFRMDGFYGWHGHDWGMPNSSSVQDYDNGPDLTGRRIR